MSRSSTTIDELPNPTPGEMLLEDFLRPMDISSEALASELGVPAARVDDVVAGRAAMTADLDLRLARFFGLSDGFWLNVQADHDLLEQRRALEGELARIQPLNRVA